MALAISLPRKKFNRPHIQVGVKIPKVPLPFAFPVGQKKSLIGLKIPKVPLPFGFPVGQKNKKEIFNLEKEKEKEKEREEKGCWRSDLRGLILRKR